MATFFMATLAVSIVGLITLISLKHWELTSGKVVLGSIRPTVGEFLHRLVYFFEYSLPLLIKAFIVRAIAALRRGMHAAVAWAVFFTERVLESTLVRLRRKTDLPLVRRTQSSHFLREVAEHKKKLQEIEDRAIYED
ncbi:hypothetical protein IT396_01515 [Candidatus Nomurabacteria bacterium]|nr:hypothetical protein [Candidatus Nomurabacteria bacterium]